jgi:hypothetical protein
LSSKLLDQLEASETMVVDRGVIGGALSTQAVDLGHRNEMGAPEPAALSFHPALLVSPADPRLAVERVKAHVGPEQDPSVGLRPVAAEQNPRHRRFEVVVADLVERYPPSSENAC